MDDCQLWREVSESIGDTDWISSDIRFAADRLLEKWQGDYTLARRNDVSYSCELTRPSEEFTAWSTSMPRAVCIAWLASKDAEKK
jgi:hypothetical protein